MQSHFGKMEDGFARSKLGGKFGGFFNGKKKFIAIRILWLAKEKTCWHAISRRGVAIKNKESYGESF